MKHKYLTAVFFFLSTLSATAQTPGGVDKPMVWSHDSTSVRVSAGAGLTYIGVSKVYGEKEQANMVSWKWKSYYPYTDN